MAVKLRTLSLSDEQKKEIIAQYKAVHKTQLEQREHRVKSSRDNYRRDYARILYSPSFRRLQGKMQILGVQSNAFYRNRLTHSLEVANIAKSIAMVLASTLDNKIYQNDIYVLDAAALAHDIGHPAFGHSGERTLDDLGKEYDVRFEGNAHNFRVLRTLESKELKGDGLNLSYRTLLAINKYIVKEDANVDQKPVKKFMFKDDYNSLHSIRQAHNLLRKRTLDVQIIELADDIAYAVHDLEDGLALRKFTIEEILATLKSDESADEYNLFNTKFVSQIRTTLYKELHDGDMFEKMFRMSLTSKLTNEFIQDIHIAPVSDKDAIEHGTDNNVQELCLNKYAGLLKKLKSAVFHCSTRDPEIRLYEHRGKIVVTSLFKLFLHEETNPKQGLLPPEYRPDLSCLREDEDRINELKKFEAERELTDVESEELKEKLKNNEKKRNHLVAQSCIDYIAGMMDTYAISEYEKYFNKKFTEIEVSWKRENLS